ncbi:MAG: oxygen-dependent coproporphyrinogen oxidase [Crocinitomicaceae bacterium]
MNKQEISEAFQLLQDHICQRVEEIDGKSNFQEDKWKRPEGGGGRTRILKGDGVVEKGGVNFSEVHGAVTDMMRQNTEITADAFFATGVSIVIHPHNPHVPIIHMNVRYFELSDGKYWFGGGIDLTPHYVIPEQAKLFHQGLKRVCDKYSPEFYPKFKVWADDYFYIPHRNETRGVGGIFFDHQKESDTLSKGQLFQFCDNLGRAFPELYAEQVKLGQDKSFGARELDWRNTRRGRYVEFNLVHDRGTKFGLVSGGRTESILMSLPATAQWEYCKPIEAESAEAHTLKLLSKNIDWLNQ